MKVKALMGFSGAVSMAAGEVRNITDEVILNDLIHAGYVECLEEVKEEEKAAAGKEEAAHTETVSENDTKTGKEAAPKGRKKKDEAKSDTEK